MVTLVEPAWVEERLDSSGILAIDPRGPMKYLRGHIKGAVSLPATRMLGQDNRLLDHEELAKLLGAAGLDDKLTPLLYDSYDGQKGAFMAWLLEYLGCAQIYLMNTFFEGWTAQGHEAFYRPVKPIPRSFKPQVVPRLRATLKDVQNRGSSKLLDVRSPEEFSGQAGPDARLGHIPGATHLMWQQFLGSDNSYLGSAEGTRQKLQAAGISQGDQVITYCRIGMRASVGFLALQQLGYDVRLYDGSYAEWSGAGLPVTTSP